MNSVISSVPTASPFGTPFVSPFASPFASPTYSAVFGQIGSPLYNSMNSFSTPFASFAAPFGLPHNTPFANSFTTPFNTPFGTTSNAQFGLPFPTTPFNTTPINTAPFNTATPGFSPFGPSPYAGSFPGAFGVPFNSTLNNQFANSQFASSFTGWNGSPFGTPFGSTFSNSFTGTPSFGFPSFGDTGFGVFGQPQSEFGAFGGRLGGLPLGWTGGPINAFGSPFWNQFAGQQFGQLPGQLATQFGSPAFGQSPWGFGGSATPWNTSTPFGGQFTNGLSQFASPVASPIASQWSGQFTQPGVTGFGSVPSTTSNGSLQTYGTQSGHSSPISPITGSTPSSNGNSQTANPMLNQVQGGFAPVGFGGSGGLPTQFVAGQFPGQPFSGSSTFVSGGFGQPIFQQPGFPTNVQPGFQGFTPFGQFGAQLGAQFGGFTGPETNGKGESRSGTTINVSQRDAA